MLTEIGCRFFSSLYTFSAAEADALVRWLQQPTLAPNEVQRDIQAFLRERIPALELPATATEWQETRDALRQKILDEIVFRGVPESWMSQEFGIVWGEDRETNHGYRIRKLRYEALPGLWIPALLYEPTQHAAEIPAVLNVNGHVGPPGKSIEYEQIRCINLAKQGMLALHPEWLVFGELQGDDYKHNRSAYLDLCGVSGLSVFYLAMKRGLDVLETYPATDPQRMAMTGLSGGGWQTILLSALDTRVAVTVPNAGYIGIENRIEHLCDVGDLEQNPNDLISIADYPCLTAMLAPRPALLIYNDRDDCCFVAGRAKPSVFDPVVPFYGLFDAAQDFEFHENHEPGTHNYDLDNRQQFYRFVQRHFFASEAQSHAEIPSDAEVLTAEELTVGLPESNADFFTLAHDLLPALPKHADDAQDARERLRDVLRLPTVTAEATVTEQMSEGELTATSLRFAVGDAWNVPALVVSRGEPKSTVLLIVDEGRARASEQVRALLDQGKRVIALDPLFMGECIPRAGIPRQAMMVAAVGERPLGIQVAQVQALIAWACQEYGTPQVSLHAQGWTAGVVASIAAGLEPERIDDVSIVEGLSSLKPLIQEHAEYERCPALFCFGLLEQFDIPELQALHRAQLPTSPSNEVYRE